MHTRHALGLAALFTLLVFSLPARAQLAFNVNPDTSGLNGTSGLLAFDLTDGDGAVNNSATVHAFSTDGTLASGGNSNTGGATGNLPGDLSLTDSAFFNESARGLTLGNNFSFQLSLTNHFAGSSPDEFAVFLLDPTGTNSLVSTNDPTGANALFVVDLTGSGSGSLSVFNALNAGIEVTITPAGVPEPGTLTALGIGCVLAWPLLRRRLR